MAYGKRMTYRNKENPSPRFMNEMKRRSTELSAEERRMERMVDGRPFIQAGKERINT